MLVTPSALVNLWVSQITQDWDLTDRPQRHHTKVRNTATAWGIPDSNLSQPRGPFFFSVWDCPAAVCYVKVPFCLMLISVIFVLYYSFTLCLWMMRLLRFERMDVAPLAKHLPRSGTDGDSLSHRIHSGGKMEIWRWSMKSTKSPPVATLRVFPEKLRTEGLKLCHIHSSWLLALPWAHSTTSVQGHDLHPLLHHGSAQGPRLSLSSSETTFLLNIHRILFFSKHVSMSMSTS